MSGADDDAGRAGWTLVQLSELTRRAEELLLDGIAIVGLNVHAGMPPDGTVALGDAELRRVTAALAEGVEIAEQLDQLASRLPGDAVEAGYDEVRDAAAADLAAGIGDARRVLLAARMLDVTHGWPALATALRAGGVAAAWEGLTLEALLCRFRGADRPTVVRIVGEAGLTPSARWSVSRPERLAALAAGLNRHASGQPSA